VNLIIFVLISLVLSLGVVSTEAFAAENNQICIDKVWIENNKGKIACVTPSTASALVERGWGTILEDSTNMQVIASMFAVHPEKMRTAAPLPETSIGPQIDYSKGYLVEEIKDGLYWVTDGAYQAMFLTTGQGVIAVDAPPSIGEN